MRESGILKMLTPTEVGVFKNEVLGEKSENQRGLELERRIKSARRRLNRLPVSPEDEPEISVQERTTQLESVVEELTRLRERQDGDFFLTSLLLKPFSPQKYRGKRFIAEGRLRQKTEYSFRNREGEIGGDLSMLKPMTLRGREYCVFLNADAMGKSLQGASGALVLASVLQARISRTSLDGHMARLSPEKWLQQTILNLQEVFSQFDGTMMASMILGLGDAQTGVLYRVNLEHPFPVLYRNGRATFISDDDIWPRLGMPDLERCPPIEVLELEPGDSFISASDGRDDLKLQTKEGLRMNDDMERFLSLVEEAEGDPERIDEYIRRTGELTDDLSIVRILGLAAEGTPKSRKRDRSERHGKVRELYEQGRYGQAARMAEANARAYPTDAWAFLAAASGYVKARETDRAFYWTDRLLLRSKSAVNEDIRRKAQMLQDAIPRRRKSD